MKFNVDRRTAVLKFERLNAFPEILELRVPLEHVRPDKPDVDPTRLESLSKIWTSPITTRSETLRLSRFERDMNPHGPPLRAAALKFLKPKDEVVEEVFVSEKKEKNEETAPNVDEKKNDELISLVLEHDLELCKLKSLLREGHNTYITAISKVTQQNAYNALTKHLLVVS